MKLRTILDRRKVVVEVLEIDEISRTSIRAPDQDICAEIEDRGLVLTFDFVYQLSNFVVSGSRLLLGCDELTDSTLVNFILSEKESVSPEMKRFWELESLGIRGDEIYTGMEDKEGLKELNKTVLLGEIDIVLSCRGIEGMQEKL
ncbi:DUF1758 domain-containing protein [Nephila pilipes]|uniref:DUF1758 domain-containing protein n=1 Tax=Nephila pilipes TaxID=299642 RepID=A0A8X6Q6Y9_NEPPI|nr:DUF1758 domain-containing protein [Nephila pilipes]